jgi:Immunoglobulin I-set domain.
MLIQVGLAFGWVNWSTVFNFSEVQVTPRQQSAPEGSQVTIECKSNDPSATIKWSKDNQEQLPPNMIAGETLIINGITKADEGVYICSIQNAQGNVFQDYASIQVDSKCEFA